MKLQEKKIEQARLLSVDFFRGLTMFLLIAEFTRLFAYFTASEFEGTFLFSIGTQLHHHPWNGLRFWDLIQPFFMFIVGVAMPLSYQKRIGRGESHQKIFKHIAFRSLLLLLLGWWLYCIPEKKIVFHMQNVLTQLSITIFISFLIIRQKTGVQILVSLVLLGITEFAYRIFWIEGFNQPFTAGHNFGEWIEVMITGKLPVEHWVSINAIPTTAHTIWGVLAGKLLISKKTSKRKLLIMIVLGLACLIIGYGLNPVTPIIKKIATSSFIFASGGWSFLALAFSFWLIDMMKVQQGVRFFAIVGMNPLFIYLFAHIGGANMISEVILPFTNTFFFWSDKPYVNLVTASMVTLGLWYICYWMYKRRIFIKI